MNIFRHGDVDIKQIEKLPTKLKKSGDLILAFGEVTGHSHRFTDRSQVEVFLAADGMKYLKVLSPSPLIHEEHKEIKILPGLYEVKIEREWDYSEEEMKKVVD
ncbi:MAG TPA: hypothetical protein DD730_09860 [Desulfosporosinus sp.]|jgi:hypothetical protein|nr:hypothetical protein [Desulfosporosinus sp.]